MNRSTNPAADLCQINAGQNFVGQTRVDALTGMPMAFTLTSPAFAHGAFVPARHTCEGADLSPALEWGAPPPDTQSLALVCSDPDAPGGTYMHWAVYDIPPDVRMLPEAMLDTSLPVGARQAVNDFGRVGYGGPCPPVGHGPHRYFFRLFALDTARLQTGNRPSCGQVVELATRHALGQAELMGRYSR